VAETRPLNFLHLTTFYPPYSFGGDAMYLYRLAHALGDAGHHVDVVHCVDSYHLLHPGEPEVRFEEHPRVARHELRSPFKWLSPLATQQTGQPYLKLDLIRRLLASKPYDVIHFHNISLLGPGVLKVQSSSPAVKMYTTHEHWLICPMHVLWKFNSRPCEKPECLRCTLIGKRPPQVWRYTGLLKRAARHVDQFVSPSRFTAGMHAERGFSQPVAHLPYFIPRIDRDWREPGPRPQEAPYFLFVGRLEIIKGLQTLIELWGRRAVDFDLLIAGTGTYEAELRAMARSNPRIKFLGPLPQRELGALYYHALAAIIPSITYETFGMINIEAFARKTPVIARDLGALPEVIQDSGGGFSYNTEDELIAAMHQIAGSTALRAELGQKGYEGFIRWWTTEAHLEMYFDFLRRNAEKKFGRPPWDVNPAAAVEAAHTRGRLR
jgi:glycosyltransferase involved in cell wall biosynthesis